MDYCYSKAQCEEFYLTYTAVDFPQSFQFPYCLFTCASLTKLSIITFWVFKFPPSICLSSLKHLILKFTIFPDAESITRFISGCPVLETMCLLSCHWQDMESVCICAPKLRKLEITESEYFDPDIEQSCDVIISGPYLNYFHYMGEFSNIYSLYDLPSLDEGKIDLDSNLMDIDEEVLLTRLCNLLKGLSRVKKLSLSSRAIKKLNQQTALPAYMPVFNNLLILSFNSGKVELDSIALTKILQNSPRLETLCFAGGVLSAHCNRAETILEPVPSCFGSHLKTIELHFYCSYEKRKPYLKATEILLLKATILQKLIVYIPSESANKEKVIADLTQLRRASSVCQIRFVEF